MQANISISLPVLSSPLSVKRDIADIICVRCFMLALVCASVRPDVLVITYIYIYIYKIYIYICIYAWVQNNLAQLLSLRRKSATLNIFSGRLKVKVTLAGS